MGYPETNAHPWTTFMASPSRAERCPPTSAPVHGVPRCWTSRPTSSPIHRPPARAPRSTTLTVAPAAGDRGSTVTARRTGYNQCVANWYVTVGPRSRLRNRARRTITGRHGCCSRPMPRRARPTFKPGATPARAHKRSAMRRSPSTRLQRRLPASSAAAAATTDHAPATADATADDDHDEPWKLEELDHDDTAASMTTP